MLAESITAEVATAAVVTERYRLASGGFVVMGSSAPLTNSIGGHSVVLAMGCAWPEG